MQQVDGESLLQLGFAVVCHVFDLIYGHLSQGKLDQLPVSTIVSQDRLF